MFEITHGSAKLAFMVSAIEQLPATSVRGDNKNEYIDVPETVCLHLIRDQKSWSRSKFKNTSVVFLQTNYNDLMIFVEIERKKRPFGIINLDQYNPHLS